jgi:hypothetical protein
MNYHGAYVSNEVTLTDEEAFMEWLQTNVEQYLDESVAGEGAIPSYHLDGTVNVSDGTLRLESSATTFQVWDSSCSEDKTEEFLEDLSEFIEESLLVRSIGHTGTRHIPDAYQWWVTPEGLAEWESLGQNPIVDEWTEIKRGPEGISVSLYQQSLDGEVTVADEWWSTWDEIDAVSKSDTVVMRSE